MATMPIYDAAPDVRGYNSDRVFNGVRILDANATARHRARVLRLLKKREQD
jgi:hypothetical protein